MRAAVFEGPRSIEVADRPDPVVASPTDAVVRVVLGCVCGSDLWYFRGKSPHELGAHCRAGVTSQCIADSTLVGVPGSGIRTPRCAPRHALRCDVHGSPRGAERGSRQRLLDRRRRHRLVLLRRARTQVSVGVPGPVRGGQLAITFAVALTASILEVSSIEVALIFQISCLVLGIDPAAVHVREMV